MIKDPWIQQVASTGWDIAVFIFWGGLIVALLIRWLRYWWGYAFGKHDIEVSCGCEEDPDDDSDEDEDEDGEDTTDPGSSPGLGSIEADASGRDRGRSHDEGEYRGGQSEDQLHVSKKEEG